VRANKIDRIEIDSPHARFGIMTAGKAYLDTRQALSDLGLDDETCARIGIRLYKVGCVWPLEAHGARAFAEGLHEILVVEEKRQIMEYALKEELYNWRDDVRPRSTASSTKRTTRAANGRSRRTTGCCRRTTSCPRRSSPRPSPRGSRSSTCPATSARASRRGWP
jgi:TPP-dependent indolepyruvate ferredoxin oxidoreductase alpha subunit